MKELNKGKLLLSKHRPMEIDKVWSDLFDEDLFLKIIKSFKYAFTMDYNEESCLFFMGYTATIMFNTDTQNMSNVDKFKTDSETIVSHWEKNTFVEWYGPNLIITKVSGDNTFTPVSVMNRTLCFDDDGLIYGSNEPCENVNQTWNYEVKQGFITENTVYLFGHMHNNTEGYVFSFNTQVLNDSESYPLKKEILTKFISDTKNRYLAQGFLPKS